MPKKIELSSDKQQLFNELKKLSKQANQRILRLERLTGAKETFASKKLFDYLSAEKLQAISKKGRVKISGFDMEQMDAIKTALEDFLSSGYSTIGEIKKYKTKVEKAIGTSLSYKDLSEVYKARDLWKWTDDQFGSAFWVDFAPQIMYQNKNEWIKFVEVYVQDGNDKESKEQLTKIYNYIRKHGIKGAVTID